MAARVELIDPAKISPNPDNPRLIFRIQELEELEQSIESQGILVPLAVYSEGKKFILLDGERRWRCSRKLGLHNVPAIVQPKPERVQNIMMMFAIHNARRDWDPLPTALKLQDLERELTRSKGTKLTETELAAAASLSRGAVRRYRKILRIPKDIQKLLLKDLDDPSNKNPLSVDQVIEAVDAAEGLSEAKVIVEFEKREIIDVVIQKFRDDVIRNTVEPRKLGAIGRAVVKGELSLNVARRGVRRFLSRPKMEISELVSETIENVERHKSLDRNLRVFEEKWLDRLERDPSLVADYESKIRDLIRRLEALL